MGGTGAGESGGASGVGGSGTGGGETGGTSNAGGAEMGAGGAAGSGGSGGSVGCERRVGVHRIRDGRVPEDPRMQRD
jgi:hypothetical protein